VFVFPSDSETLGFAAIEAMAAGVPVVAADAGGIPHIVQAERTGLLVPAGDADATARAILRLLEDPALRAGLAHNGRQEAERWSWMAATEALVERYRQAIAVRSLSAARRARERSVTAQVA
jgi:glycosyltransferase involved in cell wall biosynthesis